MRVPLGVVLACWAGRLAGFGVAGCRRVRFGVVGLVLGCVGARRGGTAGAGFVGISGSRWRSAGAGDGEEGSGSGVLFGQAQQGLS